MKHFSPNTKVSLFDPKKRNVRIHIHGGIGLLPSTKSQANWVLSEKQAMDLMSCLQDYFEKYDT